MPAKSEIESSKIDTMKLWCEFHEWEIDMIVLARFRFNVHSCMDIFGIVIDVTTLPMTSQRSVANVVNTRAMILSVASLASWIFHANALEDAAFAWQDEQHLQEISSSPRIYQIDDFLTPSECETLRQHGEPGLEPSLTIDRSSGNVVPDPVRTNMQMYVSVKDSLEHPLIRTLVRRLYKLARMPLGHGERIQIGRYRIGEKYDCHFDSELRQGVIRSATIIAYLSDVEGGDTLFPMGQNCQVLAQCCSDSTNSTAMKHLHPKLGRAILFFSHDMDSNLNPHAIHCSCPVTQGEKWILQAWFRSQLYDESPHNPLRTSDVEFAGL